MPHFTKLTPNLIVDNVERSLRFYSDVLGFERGMTVPDHAPFVFGSVTSGAVEIFFNDAAAAVKEYPDLSGKPIGATGTMYIEVDAVDALHGEIKDRVRVVMPLVTQFYGVREFAIEDPELAALSTRVHLGIVSNNLVAEQLEKIRYCGLEPYLSAIVIAEEAGVAKPDPAIFRMAMERLACDPQDAVMIGDSWSADIAGARAAGIRAIWFNRSGDRCPDPPAQVPEIRSLVPVEDVLAIVLSPTESIASVGR